MEWGNELLMGESWRLRDGESKHELSNRMGCNVETTEFSTLNAQEIAKAEFDYSALERLEKKIKEEADYKEIAEVIEIWIEDGTEGFLLSDVSNLGISTGHLTGKLQKIYLLSVIVITLLHMIK